MASVLSNKIAREALKPGDHIYSWRNAYIYAHHGIFVGDDQVIHFTPAAGQEIGTGTVLDRLLFSSSPASPATSCSRCTQLSSESHPSQNGSGVISSCLGCFLAGGHLYLFSYSVSLAFFLTQARGGTCTLAPSDPPDLVLHRARFLLTHGFGAYSLFKKNCEDFAIYCKTGLLIQIADLFSETAFSVGGSGQLSSVAAAITALSSDRPRYLRNTIGGLTVFTTVKYCMYRYLSDISIRRDVIKVPVERLVDATTAAASNSF